MNIDFKELFPEYTLFYQAMEKGESWYDIIEKMNKLTGKKRKNPYINNSYEKNKKIRFE
jgi:hypothetical protein